MGQIELHERLFGSGLTGTIDTGLSSSDSAALDRITSATSDLSSELRGLQRTTAEISGAVYDVGRVLGFQLESQTQLLDRSLSALQSIDQALRTPAKTPRQSGSPMPTSCSERGVSSARSRWPRRPSILIPSTRWGLQSPAGR